MKMTQASKTVLERFQVRKSKRQKAEFRAWLCAALQEAGYAPREERSRSLGANVNVVAGDPEGADFLLTAHYDTQAVMPVPNFITPRNFLIYLLYQLLLVAGMFALALVAAGLAAWAGLPAPGPSLVWGVVLLFFCWWMIFGKANRHTANDNTSGVLTLLETALALPEEARGRVCFVFFDNEEKGMLGSSAFASKHPAVKRDKLVLNFDCVSDGDYIQFFPTKGLKKDPETLERLEAAFSGRGGKEVQVVRSFGFYPSDNASFKRAAGVCALKKGRAGYYMDRIHTGRDTVLDEDNLLLLRDGALRLAERRDEGEVSA